MHGVHEAVGSSPTAPTSMEDQTQQLQAILERNKRVELEKAWETSSTRRAFIAVCTYIATAFLFWINDLPIPLLQALIPSAAYLLSTLSLPWLKRTWAKKLME
jgi:hypothetical protein